MTRATKLLAVTTVVGLAASTWLYVDNRSLRSELAEAPAKVVPSPAKETAAPATGDAWLDATKPQAAAVPKATSGDQPALPDEPKESRLDRRARRTEEFGAMFGRHEGETEEEYRARIGPMISAGLAVPRMRAIENRRIAEEKAGVTPEQSAKLDQAFEKTYADVMDYTNKAITDGVLSPYERNVSGWLEYAGGLGGMLTETQGSIGKILSPDQMKKMSASGFEWGEYLGLQAPWQELKPPPPQKPNN
ncbi:MAG: hypothetical protein H0T42_33000 [Deltaproteobacteria bacterium]|nr:hypothetical protein [Deltaproteobacteria bacterium]